MTVVAGILMALVAVLIVIIPFIQRTVDNEESKPTHDKNGLQQRKEILMSTLGEIEFDYKMSKLTKEDYQELKELYKERAVSLFKAEDKLKGVSEEEIINDVERELEKELNNIEMNFNDKS